MVKTGIALLLMVLASVAGAHNVVGGVYAIGSSIEGEIGFSNGDMAEAGAWVVVSDSAGNELGRVQIEEEGLFVFQAQQRIDHHFSANLSAGHVFSDVLPASELPDSLAVGSVNTTPQASNVGFSLDGNLGNRDGQAALQVMIEKAVAKQIKPLRQELAAYKEKASLQDIIGGIGYIFGLCGLGIWWRQKQQIQRPQPPLSKSED